MDQNQTDDNTIKKSSYLDSLSEFHFPDVKWVM